MRYVSLERNSTAEARLRPRPVAGTWNLLPDSGTTYTGFGEWQDFWLPFCEVGFPEVYVNSRPVMPAWSPPSVVTASSDHGRLNLDPVHHDPVPIIAVCLIYIIYY